jgi:hypothetical protein
MGNDLGRDGATGYGRSLNMSDAIEPSLRRKLWMTPWRDLLRGRLTLRLDVAAHIRAAEIPNKAKEVIAAVVRRTRLWRSEKVAVAEELIAHFADGLEAGEPIDRLIEKFGDEHCAARLIRRAKLRNRPLVWRSTAVAVRAFETLLLLHLLLTIRFYAGHPSPSFDYPATVNERTLATSIDQRAWPIYRHAMVKLSDYAPPDQFNTISRDDLEPGRPGWAWMAGWLQAHAAGLELARQAAGKPILGFEYNTKVPQNERANWTPIQEFLNPLRKLANFLAKDSELAILDGDANRFSADMTALLNMADQIRTEPTLISGYCTLGLRFMGISEINMALSHHAAVLRDSDLPAMAHQLARFGDPADMFNLRGEQWRFTNLVQYLYTDDGHANGRFTPDGLQARRGWGPFDFSQAASLYAIGPEIMEICLSRRELIDKFNRWYELADHDLHTTMRDSPISVADAFLMDTKNSAWRGPESTIMADESPSIHNMRINAEVLLGERDGAQVGLALEAYRRQHAQYPTSLQEMVPLLLPAVPADRITGGPLKYRLANGKPVVYSVGVDRKDDGGREPNVRGQPDNLAAARWPDSGWPNTPVDGDWILYPLPTDNN